MSKNVKLNGNDYLGVSTVQIPTTDGGTASFKDVDEIVVPTGSKNITENGTYDVTAFASAVVNVPTGGAGGMESGTILGNGTNTLEIPVTSAKTHLIIWASADDVLAEAVAWTTAYVHVIKGEGMYYNANRYDGKDLVGYAVLESAYTSANVVKAAFCDFNDPDAITIALSPGSNDQKFSSAITYNWIAF